VVAALATTTTWACVEATSPGQDNVNVTVSGPYHFLSGPYGSDDKFWVRSLDPAFSSRSHRE
jgi:hypothetical protein